MRRRGRRSNSPSTLPSVARESFGRASHALDERHRWRAEPMLGPSHPRGERPAASSESTGSSPEVFWCAGRGSASSNELEESREREVVVARAWRALTRPGSRGSPGRRCSRRRVWCSPSGRELGSWPGILSIERHNENLARPHGKPCFRGPKGTPGFDDDRSSRFGVSLTPAVERRGGRWRWSRSRRGDARTPSLRGMLSRRPRPGT